MKARITFGLAAVLALQMTVLCEQPRGAGGGGNKVSRFQNAEMEKFQGVWRNESVIGPHGEVPKENLKNRSLLIEGNKFVRKANGKTFMEGRFAIDTTGKQKILVMIPTDRREAAQVWALYEIEGDTLKICYELLGVGRPTEFKAGDTQSVAVYKRQKP